MDARNSPTSKLGSYQVWVSFDRTGHTVQLSRVPSRPRTRENGTAGLLRWLLLAPKARVGSIQQLVSAGFALADGSLAVDEDLPLSLELAPLVCEAIEKGRDRLL